MKLTQYILAAFFTSLFFQSSHAASLSYSGRLVNTPDGSPVVGNSSGLVNMKFDLAYSGSTSSVLCTKTITGVPLTNGVFHVKLDYTSSECGGQSLVHHLQNTPAGESVAIRVTDIYSSKTYSWQAIHSIPSAVIAENLAKMGATSGQVLKWNGTSWAPGSDDGGAGSITSITASGGLAANGTAGGTISSSGTITIDNGGVATAKLADEAVTNTKIANAAAIARTKLASGTPNTFVYNAAGTGVMGEISIATAQTALGLGAAAYKGVGSAMNEVLSISDVMRCNSNEKLSVTPPPTVTWTCLPDAETDSTKLPLAGGTMTGDIVMGGNRVLGLPTPSVSNEAATKAYVDTLVTGNSFWAEASGNVYRSTGRVGVGTTSPDAAFEVSSTTSGVLIPRMTEAQRDAIVSPATGLQVYTTNTNELNYYNGTAWRNSASLGPG